MLFKPLFRLGLTALISLVLPACGGSTGSHIVPGVASPPISPTPTGQQRDLLYVSNQNGTVNVYRYWQQKLATVLTKFKQPSGQCSDQSGNVFITDYQAKKVYEYAHGGSKPIATLDTSPYTPRGCAVSPATGDLAIADYGTRDYSYYGDGNIAIYRHASGTPTFYGGGDDNHFPSVAYDDRGDLLALSESGYSGHWYYYATFFYLPKKGLQLLRIDVPCEYSSSCYWQYATAVAWDGKYWVIEQYRLYLYSINVKVKYVGEVDLTASYRGIGPVAFYPKTSKGRATQVVAAINNYNGKSAVDYWKYPAGGSPIAQVTQGLDNASGVAISLWSNP